MKSCTVDGVEISFQPITRHIRKKLSASGVNIFAISRDGGEVDTVVKALDCVLDLVLSDSERVKIEHFSLQQETALFKAIIESSFGVSADDAKN